MCRLAAYLGPELSLEEFIISPPHSLYKQSWQPKEMDEATLNADGFGFAWYESDQLPRYYRNTIPIWSDTNFSQLAPTMKKNHWLAYVRSATPGQGNGIDNTQPFIHQNLTFIHNGFIKDFEQIKPKFIEQLAPETIAEIKGNTDSEYLFALWKQIHTETNSILKTYQEFLAQLKTLCKDKATLINTIVSDGNEIGASKFALNANPPSLYYLLAGRDSNKSIIIASEPFDQQAWQTIPDNSVFMINNLIECKTHRLD